MIGINAAVTSITELTAVAGVLSTAVVLWNLTAEFVNGRTFD